MNAIDVNEMCYTYEEGTVALDKLNFRAEKGKITGIIGANGAGKSTLFLCLNGVMKPLSGEVDILNERVKYDTKGIAKLRQKVGIVFQDPDNQLFSADVYRDISFGAINLGLSEEETRNRVEQAMQSTDIAHLKDKPTHALSFGQKKRVAIAGVLVMRPEILILDEPTAGLDPQGVSDILKLCKQLQKDYGMTIIVATHDMDTIPLFCDYVYLISQGKMITQGTYKEVFRNPSLLRKNRLRLPRISHLMEILSKEDKLNVDIGTATISEARKQIIQLIKE